MNRQICESLKNIKIDYAGRAVGDHGEIFQFRYGDDGLDWQRATRFQRRQPFDFTLSQDKCPPPGEYLRGAARDVLGTTAVSDPFQVPYGTP